MKRNSVLIGAVVIVLAASLIGVFAYRARDVDVRAGSSLPKDAAAALVRFYSPNTGANDAKVTIVEFLDPSCETCGAFYPIVKSILGEHQGKVRLVVRYAPFHKDSDVVIRILEAAKLQGLYWQSLEAAFQSQRVWAEHGNPQTQRIWESLRPLGLDVERAKRDMESPSITSMLKQEVADLQALKVEKTPTFFVNGKPLAAFSEANLRAMVQLEVKVNYP